jgi:hypothetical protein
MRSRWQYEEGADLAPHTADTLGVTGSDMTPSDRNLSTDDRRLTADGAMTVSCASWASRQTQSDIRSRLIKSSVKLSFHSSFQIESANLAFLAKAE